MKPRLGALAALCLLTAIVASGCAPYQPDVDALRAHLEQRCKFTFAAPLVTCDDQAIAERQTQLGFERSLTRHVTAPETEACILAVECEDDPALDDADELEDDLRAVAQCVADDPNRVPDPAMRLGVDTDCLQKCEQDLYGCDPGCDEVAHRACFDSHDRCRSAC